MSYTVVWTPAAEADLAGIWLADKNRKAITSASRIADRLLREEPHSQGESREGTTRIMFVTPLALQFEIVEADRIVYVLALRLMKQRGTES
jgi:plasmid stabilization system protein ParE